MLGSRDQLIDGWLSFINIVFSLKDYWHTWERSLTEAEINLESKLHKVMEFEESFDMERMGLMEALSKCQNALNQIMVDELSVDENEDKQKTMKTFRQSKVENIIVN